MASKIKTSKSSKAHSVAKTTKARPRKSAATKVKPSAAKVAKPAGARAATVDLTGRPAPAFTLPDQDGNPVSLASLTAQGHVVLYFYPKDSTPGCTTEACGFRDRLDAVRALGAQVVGVSADSPASHVKFIAKQSLNFPLLSDSANAVTKAYGVYKMKSLYGRQFLGIERTTFVIDRGGMVRKAFPKVKVNGHTEEVIAALSELR